MASHNTGLVAHIVRPNASRFAKHRDDMQNSPALDEHPPAPHLQTLIPSLDLHPTDAPEFRGCLTIQNHNKNKHRQDVISKNKHPISRNIYLWDNLFIAGWHGWGFGIIVSVVEPDGGVDSTNEARREELRQILWW